MTREGGGEGGGEANPVLHENVTARPCVRVLGGTTPPLARTPGAGQKAAVSCGDVLNARISK